MVDILSLWDNAGNASKNPDSDGSCYWIIWVHHWVDALQELIHIQNLIQMFFTLLGDLKDAEPKKITPENKIKEVSLVFWTVFSLLVYYTSLFSKSLCLPTFASKLNMKTFRWYNFLDLNNKNMGKCQKIKTNTSTQNKILIKMPR